MLESIWSDVTTAFAEERLRAILWSVVILVVGTILARLIAAGVGRLSRRTLSLQNTMIIRRLTFYGLFGLVVMIVLRHLGLDLGVLLGAAGILTVALGFASQTSASNLISGLFLIGERPFVIGDVIRLGTDEGEVVSIDLLSVKLRTWDNLLLRIPNETLLKTQITNLTHFEIRRLDIPIGVAYKEDVPRVRELLLDVADRHPMALDEPKAVVQFRGFAESSLDLKLAVWASQTDFYELRNSILVDIKRAFDEAGVEIPFPHRTLYAGSVTEPFPVRHVPGPSSQTEGTDGQGA